MSQGVGSEFKPQFLKKKEKRPEAEAFPKADIALMAVPHWDSLVVGCN
jgi:hypothetical protein